MCKLTNGLVDDFSDIELNGGFLEIVTKFCNLGGTIGARRGAVDSIRKRISNSWSKLRYLLPLLTSKGLPLERRFGSVV